MAAHPIGALPISPNLKQGVEVARSVSHLSKYFCPIFARLQQLITRPWSCNRRNPEAQARQQYTLLWCQRNPATVSGLTSHQQLKSYNMDIYLSCTTDKYNLSLVFSGDRKITNRGPIVPVGNQALPSFPLNGGPENWDFLLTRDNSDRLFFLRYKLYLWRCTV